MYRDLCLEPKGPVEGLSGADVEEARRTQPHWRWAVCAAGAMCSPQDADKQRMAQIAIQNIAASAY